MQLQQAAAALRLQLQLQELLAGLRTQHFRPAAVGQCMQYASSATAGGPSSGGSEMLMRDFIQQSLYHPVRALAGG